MTTHIVTRYLHSPFPGDDFRSHEIHGDDEIVEISQQVIYELTEDDRGAPVDLVVDGKALRLESKVIDRSVYFYRRLSDDNA